MKVLSLTILLAVLACCYCNGENGASPKPQAKAAAPDAVTASGDTSIVKCDTVLLPGDTIYYIHGVYNIGGNLTPFKKYVRVADNLPISIRKPDTTAIVHNDPDPRSPEVVKIVPDIWPISYDSVIRSNITSDAHPLPLNPDSVK
jgi:hypothetical protein